VRVLTSTIMALTLVGAGIAPARAMPCDPAGADVAAIAAARADVAAHCDCSGFTSHKAHVSCSATIIGTRVQHGQLRRPCKGLVQRDATKSTCGTPAAVSCCTTGAAGKTKCRIRKSEGSCGPRGSGTACVGSFPSCGDACTASGCAPGPTIPSPPTSTPCTGACPIHTVFVILLENHDWSSIKGSTSAPYINNTLLPMASHAEQYFNPPSLHPSEPNYLWLEAGTNFGILDDNDPARNHQNSTSHLVTLLETAGLSWRAYQEDTSGIVCPLTDLGDYAVRHDPFVFFDDVTNANDSYASRCIDHVRPYAELQPDLGNDTVARYNFITPNVCDDMHDTCAPLNDPVKQGDSWLSTEVPKILGSQAYANNGVLFITWDEAENGDGPIGMIMLSPKAKGGGYANALHYTHGSTLRTVEEIFGVTPLLGDAASAADLSDLFAAFP
jgi:hypothetical protein